MVDEIAGSIAMQCVQVYILLYVEHMRFLYSHIDFHHNFLGIANI